MIQYIIYIKKGQMMKLKPLSSYYPSRLIANAELQITLCYNCKYNTNCENRYKAVNKDPYNDIVGIDDKSVIVCKRKVIKCEKDR